MAEQKPHVCKQCGYYTTKEVCPNCDANNMVSEKPKGMAVIFNCKESKIAEKINAKNNGIYALKY
jgi:RNA polymerase subunit RPABC4/transcription elongation factor Spt4